MTQPTCETCRFWGAQFATIKGRNYANCQRNAPKVMPYHPGGYTDRVDSETVWARTEQLDFCGEHQPTQTKAPEGGAALSESPKVPD